MVCQELYACTATAHSHEQAVCCTHLSVWSVISTAAGCQQPVAQTIVASTTHIHFPEAVGDAAANLQFERVTGFLCS
jgi:hypothetical protein